MSRLFIAEKSDLYSALGLSVQNMTVLFNPLFDVGLIGALSLSVQNIALLFNLLFDAELIGAVGLPVPNMTVLFNLLFDAGPIGVVGLSIPMMAIVCKPLTGAEQSRCCMFSIASMPKVYGLGKMISKVCRG